MFQTLDRLQMVYSNVDDIDLLIGVLAELPSEGAMVGPTLQCILGEQFYRTRHGDRLFYDQAIFTAGENYNFYYSGHSHWERVIFAY